MANDPCEALLDRLGPAALAVLIGQRMQHEGHSVCEPNEAVVAETALWVKAQGLNPYGVAHELVAYLHDLYSSEPLSHSYVCALAVILWQILGDPKSGDPPPIYLKAAAACFAAMLRSFDTSALSKS
jgi:hypothetical protein